MEVTGTLEVLAEIAIAFAGFAGIVGALAGTKLSPDHPSVWLPFWCIIEFSLATLFAALLPIVHHELGAPSPLVWALSSGILAAFLLCHFVLVTPRFLRADRQGVRVRLPWLDAPILLALVLAFSFFAIRRRHASVSPGNRNVKSASWCRPLGRAMIFLFYARSNATANPNPLALCVLQRAEDLQARTESQTEV